MLTAQEGAKQSRALDQLRKQALRETTRKTLRELREQWRVERAHRDTMLVGAATHCRADRLALREKAFARRQHALAELRDTYAQERADARSVCVARKADVHAAARDPIERAHGKWKAEREYQNDLQRIERGNRQRHRALKRTHAAERRSESDDEVRANLEADYVPLFERVKRSIKGSSRESRTEAFLRYAEENPKELLAALEEESERKLHQMLAEREKAERVSLPPPVRARKYTPAELAAVPF